MSKKLEQVLEYLIAGKQDKAKELLHKVFIDKARKIHEDIMSDDEYDDEVDYERDNQRQKDARKSDFGDGWKKNIMGKHDRQLGNMSDEIDAEETMAR